MKKLSIFALAAVFAVSASAQDTFKQVKKIKNYDEAAKLVKANEASMQPAEAADCYNYLTKLSIDKVSDEAYKITDNQVQQSMGGTTKPVDYEGMWNAVRIGLYDANACDKYDQTPNAKGKVPNKYRKKNADFLYIHRDRLLDAAMKYQGEDPIDTQKLFNATSAYVDAYKWPLFDEVRKPDPNFSQMAYFASLYAYQMKNYDDAVKYATEAVNDSAWGTQSVQIMVLSVSQDLKTKADTLKCIEKLKGFIAQYPENEIVFQQTVTMYNSCGMTAEAENLINTRISQMPHDYTALIMRADMNFTKKNWNPAIQDFKAAIATPDAEKRPNYIPVIAFIGNCYSQIAEDEINNNSDKTGNIPAAKVEEIKKIFGQAIEWYEKAKGLDTEKQFKQFYAYSLYNCCYRVYGEDDPRTEAAKP